MPKPSGMTAQVPLETLVRTALMLGELSPGAEAAINQARAEGRLTAQERRVLEILEDAIASNCVRQIRV